MTSLTDLLHALALCPPEQAPTLALILADWLEEHQDERCGVLRVLCKRGPVEVEPVTVKTPDLPFNQPDYGTVDRNSQRLGHFPYIALPVFVWRCQCTDFGSIARYATDYGHGEITLRQNEARWRTWQTPHGRVLVAAGRCQCGRAVWASANDIRKDEMYREMLHRLRVECLLYFWPEMQANELELPNTDPRWPQMVAEMCEAKWGEQGRRAADAYQPFDDDDLAGYAAPEPEAIRRPAHLQRQDYQPPPSRGRAYTASDRAAFKKRVEKRRAKRK